MKSRKQDIDSQDLLDQSQQNEFPYTMNVYGLEVQVDEYVFSPKYFNGWKIFTDGISDFQDLSVLEIGCGTGITSLYLASQGAKSVLATDISYHAVQNTLKNIELNEIENMSARWGDVFSSIRENEKFDIIYWNLPFMFKKADYVYSNVLERGLFDPGYKKTETFLQKATKYLTSGGCVIIGFGDFGDEKLLDSLILKYGYKKKLLKSEGSTEVNEVEFQLIPPIKQKSVFVAMPFSSKTYESIIQQFNLLHQLSLRYNVELIDQFNGVEVKVFFEGHEYDPEFIVEKDMTFINQADCVIADFGDHSIGRDFEIAYARSQGKFIVSVVQETDLKKHPWIRYYSDYIIDTIEEAFKLISTK